MLSVSSVNFFYCFFIEVEEETILKSASFFNVKRFQEKWTSFAFVERFLREFMFANFKKSVKIKE
ncbi:hypothetical protein EFL96_12435 [Lactococcus lactis]|uniref:Uncharacterized protein n=1 Tax=Lactococcus lactis TaxID=1358 RepID=A0A6M0MA93_9LACT|nr:hypothetical protein [Lactococcus lactis]MCT1182969.1 hypothetical protein [Lactococcus lactis]MCT1186514.1 hypothetical protein [Lactococcus lactis]MCT1190686.1 hypothetical protein [Lactococcus lactis]MCT1194284.1 hypothetical protein [Lactococcus lactis]